MDLKIGEMFFYVLDNWIVCTYIICIGLHFRNKFKRNVCIAITAISLAGHFITPFFYELDDAKKVWELYGATINFIKLAALYVLLISNRKYECSMVKVLAAIFLFNVVFRTFAHIDWVILETNVLSLVYAPIVQAMNILVAVILFGDWLFDFVELKLRSRYGVYQSSDNDDSFNACIGNVRKNKTSR